MNDYFDELEAGLRDATRRRAHLPWYTRLGRMSLRHRSLAVMAAALIVAAPAVAAVGVVSGWFSKGSSDRYYPASATSGLGKVLPKDGRLLPIRVADPAGGPPWGIRLVKTTRGETCIQVGRVVDGQIGALGIDDSWDNDHEFHEIKPNDQLADICGATDAAGDGFVNAGYHEAPASVNVPLDNQTDSPASSMRMIFAGLLGPDAKSIKYLTPSGKTKQQNTSGGVGAYLLVFKETAKNCGDFLRTAMFSVDPNDCQGGLGATVGLRQPGPVTSVAYASGHTCSDEPSASLVSAYHAFNRRMAAAFRKESHAEVLAQTDRFFTAHGVNPSKPFDALIPTCNPVGWIAPKQRHLVAADVTSPLKVEVIEAKRYCWRGSYATSPVVACDGKIPNGFAPFSPAGVPQVLVRVSFIARQPVSSDNSWYEWMVSGPRNGGGGGGSQTQANIHKGRRITFTTFVKAGDHGTYHGIVTFMQNAGQQGQQGFGLVPVRGGIEARDGSVVVGRFSFKLPLEH